MKTKTRIMAVLLAGAGLTAGGIAATAASDTGAQKRAVSEARDASNALKKRKADKAIAAAESAVALDPRNAGYRTLLGQAYLAAGRFTSASNAFTDALALDPDNGAAALHLALAQIATGNWDGARTTLTFHERVIPASDRGLALALAGDPAGAVAILNVAAREPGADAKTRQNFALALALAGRWAESKMVASLDVDPAEVDKRIMQWASFAQPRGAADQVAALLGVTPVEDFGQPQRLALNSALPNVAAVAQPVDTVDAFMPGQPAPAEVAAVAAEPAPAPVAEPAPVAVASAPAPVAVPEVAAAQAEAFLAPANGAPMVNWAPKREIVQALPAKVVAPRLLGTRAPVTKVRATAAPQRVASFQPREGQFFVQLGAYENAGVARDAWGRLKRRHNTLANFTPQGMNFAAGRESFYRLTVGGFSRGDADTLCRRVRAQGSPCFVRAGAGDTVAQWVSKGVQLASR